MDVWVIELWNTMSVLWRIISILILSSIIIFTINEQLSTIKDYFIFYVEKIFIKNKKNKYIYNKEEFIKSFDNTELFKLFDKIKVDLDNETFGSVGKDKIFKGIMTIYVDNIKKHVISFIINSDNFNQLDLDGFKTFIINVSNSIIIDTNKDFKNFLGIEMYNFLILDPNNGFRKWEEMNQLHESQMIHSMDYSLASNNEIRYRSFLSTKYVTLSVLSGYYNRRFYGFNGELDELIKKYGWND